VALPEERVGDGEPPAVLLGTPDEAAGDGGAGVRFLAVTVGETSGVGAHLAVAPVLPSHGAAGSGSPDPTVAPSVAFEPPMVSSSRQFGPEGSSKFGMTHAAELGTVSSADIPSEAAFLEDPNMRKSALCLLLVTSGAAYAAHDATSVLNSARQYEQTIRSGSIRLRKVVQIPRVSEQQLKSIATGQKELQLARELARVQPSLFAEEMQLRFDNGRKRLLAQGTRSGDSPTLIPKFQILFTQMVTRNYYIEPNQRPGAGQMATISKPSWPPPWPYNLWRSRFWNARWEAVEKKEMPSPTLLHFDPNAGEAIIRLIGSQLDQKIWVDTRHGHSMSRLQLFDKKARLNEDVTASYRHHGGRIWYPQKLVDSYYMYDRQGKRYLSRVETTTVASAELNMSLHETDLELGPVPRRTDVQDDRFTPPLRYLQGNRQFTDRELFELARQRSLANDPRWLETSPPPFVYVVAGVGFFLVVCSIFFGRRTNREPQR
jgi:hypothetical protein